MTTMAQNGVTQSPHAGLGPPMAEEEQYLALPEMERLDVSSVNQQLYSKQLMTVEQLNDIVVDADIQTSVDEFLKGLTQQMFARIVRNGSGEVAQWLGAKVQGERDGWTAMLRMSMDEIESHRKNALRYQAVLHDTLDQLRLLTDCFALDERVKKELNGSDAAQGIRACVQVLAECFNGLMEDRFRCFDILCCTEPLPDDVSGAVEALRDKVALLEADKEALKKQCEEKDGQSSQLKAQNQHMLDEVQKMEERVKTKQDDLEALKKQLKEIDQAVKFRKTNTVGKCVGTDSDLNLLFREKTKDTTSTGTTMMASSRPASKMTHKASTSPSSSLSSSGSCVPPAREHTYTQTFRDPSFVELSEEKLRVLKERARKLESSLHGAIASMGKLRKGMPNQNTNATTTNATGANTNTTTNNTKNLSSSTSAVVTVAPTTATFIAIPPGKHPEPKSWLSPSFEVTNTSTVTVPAPAPAPKQGQFKFGERRCYSERPAAKSSDEQSPGEKGKRDNVRLARTRLGQVSKCLRCQKLFTSTDNHKLACLYHSKSKERMEVYSGEGQLVRIKYVWKCCQQTGDADGCCYGSHV